MMIGGKICLVEDDKTIAELVPIHLRRKGFQVDVFDNSEAVIQAKSEWNLYILDILLSGEKDGLELCRWLRERYPTTPILILSALSEPLDRVEGLRGGADDYVTKPFEIEELMLRVEGMLKRSSWYGKLPEGGSIFRWTDCSIDFLSFEGWAYGKQISLTQKECMIMKLLVEKEGKVVTRDEILNQVWGYNVFPSTRTVDNFILRLRKYFEPSPDSPRFIQAVRGVGYKFISQADS